MPRHGRTFECEEQECRNCGAVFNLAMQDYYDNLCPSCKREIMQ